MPTSKFCLTPAEIEKQLAKVGIQATAQRIAISRYVLCEGNHVTADQAKDWADKNCPKVSMATVYNTLNTLVEAGLLVERRFDHLDKVVYDCNTTEHHHFLDRATGILYDIDPDQLHIRPRKIDSKFSIESVTAVLVGTVK